MSFEYAETSIFEALSIIYPSLQDGRPCVAVVGGGGKTGVLFSLAASLADRGRRVALTTTTHIMDPRLESGRRFDRVILDRDGDHSGISNACDCQRPGVSVIATALNVSTGQLVGLSPIAAASLLAGYDAVLVEADGSKRLPVKAPAANEPVVPPCAGLVLGVVGLDCLGRPMDSLTVQRPELFGPLVGCAPGETVTAAHILALVHSPSGLFKGAPVGAIRVLMLNKSDVLDEAAMAELMDTFSRAAPVRGSACGFDGVLVCSVREDSAFAIARIDGQARSTS